MLKRRFTEVMLAESHPDPKVGVAFFVAQTLKAEIPEGFWPKNSLAMKKWYYMPSAC